MRTPFRFAPLLLAFAIACGGDSSGPNVNLTGSSLTHTLTGNWGASQVQ